MVYQERTATVDQDGAEPWASLDDLGTFVKSLYSAIVLHYRLLEHTITYLR